MNTFAFIIFIAFVIISTFYIGKTHIYVGYKEKSYVERPLTATSYALFMACITGILTNHHGLEMPAFLFLCALILSALKNK